GTPPPGPSPSPPSTGSFSIQSSPSGLPVSLNGASIGVTPISQSPPVSSTATTFTIQGTNGASYTYTVSDLAGGTRTLFFNQAADTSGKIGTISPVSVARRSASAGDSFSKSLARRAPNRLASRPAFEPNELEVRYRSSALQSAGRQAADVERTAGLQAGRQIGPAQNGDVLRVVAIPPGVARDAAITQLRAQAGVVDVQPVQMRYAQAVRRPQTTVPVAPNDPRFNIPVQWDLFKIGAPNAWGYTEGSSSIPVAIVDTGADVGDPDLSSKIDCAHSEWAINGTVTNGCAAVQDQDGHGTNVAAIAAAATNNGFGYAGVGFNTSLQIYKVFPNPVMPDYENGSQYGVKTVDEAQA
ncbi:MAG: S8 family serine peptidase, partial [Vulcanimicrobiaceae bacterium]